MQEISSNWICPSVLEQFGQRDSPCFRPLIVAVGPIFHDWPQVKDVEALKPDISRNLIRECNYVSDDMIDMYKETLYDFCIEMRSRYSEEIRKRFDHQQFYDMMLSDVCFIVAVMIAVVSKKLRKLPLSVSVLRMCMRDFFLLGNQIPFHLVHDLVRLRVGNRATRIIHQFISAVIHHPLTSNRLDKQPLHLLDLLRLKYVGAGKSPEQSSDSHCNKFSSAKQLHDQGVRFFASVSQKIGYSIVDMEFDATTGSLYMPPLLIDESFESIFLNIAAYESSRCDLEKSVTTYLCLLQQLARDPESVRLLRNSVIRCKEDNKSIVKLLQRMSENLESNFLLYNRLSRQLQVFPSGKIAFMLCWLRNPSTASQVSRCFFTIAVLGAIFALADLLSFLAKSNKITASTRNSLCGKKLWHGNGYVTHNQNTSNSK